MTIIELAGIVSTLLAVISGIPYIDAVLKGRTRPHQLGWLVFTIMNGMVFFAQYLAGGRISTLISLTFFVYSVIIFLLSFSRGSKETSNSDKYLFVLALLAMFAWAITRNNDLAIWLTLIIDISATAMIILKVRISPDSEDPFPWLLGTIAYGFSCITLLGVNFGILYVRPIYGLVCDGVLVGAIYYFSSQQKPKQTRRYSKTLSSQK